MKNRKKNLRKTQVIMKTFTILYPRKKLNIFTLHRPIYYMIGNMFIQNRKSRFLQMRTLQKRSEKNMLSFL